MRSSVGIPSAVLMFFLYIRMSVLRSSEGVLFSCIAIGIIHACCNVPGPSAPNPADGWRPASRRPSRPQTPTPARMLSAMVKLYRQDPRTPRAAAGRLQPSAPTVPRDPRTPGPGRRRPLVPRTPHAGQPLPRTRTKVVRMVPGNPGRAEKPGGLHKPACSLAGGISWPCVPLAWRRTPPRGLQGGIRPSSPPGPVFYPSPFRPGGVRLRRPPGRGLTPAVEKTPVRSRPGAP